MRGPTCTFWADLTPFSPQVTEANRFRGDRRSGIGYSIIGHKHSPLLAIRTPGNCFRGPRNIYDRKETKFMSWAQLTFLGTWIENRERRYDPATPGADTRTHTGSWSADGNAGEKIALAANATFATADNSKPLARVCKSSGGAWEACVAAEEAEEEDTLLVVVWAVGAVAVLTLLVSLALCAVRSRQPRAVEALRHPSSYHDWNTPSGG
jgi:hypothetical protein